MNEMLRQALFRARLREDDIAAHLGVDPKTVRRWLEGRIPYPRHRLAVSHLLGTDEADLWPEVHAARVARSRPEEIIAVYPHRWAVPHEVWRQFFGSAKQEIGILAYSALFLAEDVSLFGLLADKARSRVRVRIVVGDPDNPYLTEGAVEGIGDAMKVEIRNALTLFMSLLDIGNVELRLHRTVLYNSLYRADNDLLVNQHAYGLTAANAPAILLRGGKTDDMFGGYVESFERIWLSSKKPA